MDDTRTTQNAVEAQGMTPPQVDTLLSKVWEKEQRLFLERMRLSDPKRYITTFGRIEDAKRLEEVNASLTVLRAEAEPLEAEYQTRQWKRYFLVVNDNGHVHRGMNCTTCYPTTRYAWLPSLSGCDEIEVVKEYGEKMCTVCFPDAPTMAALVGPSRVAREEEAWRAERSAKKAAAAAKVAEKAIRNPDGSRIQFGRWTVDTAYQAKQELTDAVESLLHNEAHSIPNQEYVQELRQKVEVLVAALATKFNVTDESVRAEALRKARARGR